MPVDTLLVEAGIAGNIVFDNTTYLSDRWQWDFGNGYTSTIKNPKTTYLEPGLYRIRLIAANSYGCIDTTTQQLQVGLRSDRPMVADQQICKGTIATISATNTGHIKVFKHKNGNDLLFEGSQLTTGNLAADTVFYVANAAGMYESVAIPVTIAVSHPQMGFEVALDTLNLNEKYLLHIRDTETSVAHLSWYINGSLISEASGFEYKYGQETMSISQIKTDSDGCTDTLSRMISPQISAIPWVEDMEVCPNEYQTLNPENGKVFYFYKDEAMQQLVHKGRSMDIGPLSAPAKYYITGMDKLIESPAAGMAIGIDPVKARISTPAAIINLDHENEAILRNTSTAAASSFWLLPGGSFDTTSIRNEVYDLPGEYDYTVVAISKHGCADTVTQQIQVIRITGLHEDSKENIVLFPNPVSSTLHVAYDDYPGKHWELIDASGRVWQKVTLPREPNRLTIDMSGMKPGLYFLKSLGAAHAVMFKVVKM